jgi:hypothetical protein
MKEEEARLEQLRLLHEKQTNYQILYSTQWEWRYQVLFSKAADGSLQTKLLEEVSNFKATA